MNLGDLEFKPEQFEECLSEETASVCDVAAEVANRILAEKLEKARRFGLTIDEYGMREHQDSGILGTLSPTHIGRLVCIEEVRGEKDVAEFYEEQRRLNGHGPK